MTNEKKQFSPEEKHRRQTWLEIWLPLLIGLIACGTLIVLVILSAVHGNSSIAQWSSISLIVMIFPVLFIILVSILFVLTLDYFLIKGNRKLPDYLGNFRQKFELLSAKIQTFLLSIVSFFERIETLFSAVKNIFKHSKKVKS
jgi:hypothetical protein